MTAATKKYATIKFDRGDIISVDSRILPYPESEGFWARYKPKGLPLVYVGPFADRKTAQKSANRLSDYCGTVYRYGSGYVCDAKDLETEDAE